MSKMTETRDGQGVRRFKHYPAYKDSGVEWLGEIPTHWQVKRLKYLAALDPESLSEDTDPAREIVYVDIGSVDNLGRIMEKEQLTFATAPSRARKLVRNGDVIVSTVRTYLRSIAPINNPDPGMVVSTGFAVVRPADQLTSEYAAYALRAPYFVERVVANSKGVSFPAINESEMATYELIAPPETEQRAIAAFLDHETAKIDALIAKKKQVIDLLNENRMALITRVVTKGIDPNVLMKDSGVEWLGEIPKHWEVVRAKYTLKDRISGPFGSSLTKESYGGNIYRVYGQEQVIPGDFTVGDYYIPEEKFRTMTRYAVAPGDVLLSCVGTFGKATVVPEGIEPGIINPRLILLRPDQNKIVPDYLEIFLKSELAYAQMDEVTRGGTMDIINLSTISALIMPLPPRTEQEKILRTVRAESSRLDKLLARVRNAINHLKEYRAALVSAAVTGKIDVREEVE